MFLLPKGGLEPPRGCPQRFLRPPRLPFRHFGLGCRASIPHGQRRLSMGRRRKDKGRRRSGRSADTGPSLYGPWGVGRKCGGPICARRGRFVKGHRPAAALEPGGIAHLLNDSRGLFVPRTSVLFCVFSVPSLQALCVYFIGTDHKSDR